MDETGTEDSMSSDEVRDQLIRNGYHPLREAVSIEYTHKGTRYTDTVGSNSKRNGEIVRAIFALKGGSFAICTDTRGWDLEHLPIFTGSSGDDHVHSVEYDDI